MSDGARSRRRVWTLRAALAVAGILAGIALARVAGVRPGGSDEDAMYRRSDDPRLRVELVPGANGRVNRAGFLGRDYPVDKPSETLRIVVVGDSITMNGAPSPTHYLGALEDSLPPLAGRPVEVLNLAVGGDDTPQEVVRLERTGLAYRPDLVVVAYCVNDAIDFPLQVEAVTGTRDGLRGNQDDLASQQRLRDGLLARGVTWDRFQRDFVERGERWTSSLAAMDRLADLARERGFGVVVLLYPALYRMNDYYLAPLHRRLAEEATRRGFRFLDLFAAFAGGGEYPDGVSVLSFEHDPIHPGRPGEDVARQATLDWFRENRPWDRPTPGPGR